MINIRLKYFYYLLGNYAVFGMVYYTVIMAYGVTSYYPRISHENLTIQYQHPSRYQPKVAVMFDRRYVRMRYVCMYVCMKNISSFV